MVDFRRLDDVATLTQFVRNLRVGIYITARSGEIIDSNQAFVDMFGLQSLEELKTFSMTSLFTDPLRREEELRILEREGAVRDFEFEIRRPDGEQRFVLDTAYQVTDSISGETLYHGIAVDITDRKLLERRLREQAVRDALTGCYNRHHLADIVQQLESRDGSWGAIVVDVDDFKRCNDLHGHDYGDRVLVQIARFLTQEVRAEDPVFRTGGDEFVVLLPGLEQVATKEVAERFKSKGDGAAPVSFSIGWAVREEGEAVERTISRADQSLIEIRVAERRMGPRHGEPPITPERRL